MSKRKYYNKTKGDDDDSNTSDEDSLNKDDTNISVDQEFQINKISIEEFNKASLSNQCSIISKNI